MMQTDELILAGSRGSGKTFVMLSTVFEHAQKNPKSKIAVMSADGPAQLRYMVRAYVEYVERYGNIPRTMLRYNESSAGLEHPNGSVVHFFAHEDRLRGWNPDLLAVYVGDPLAKYRGLAYRGKIVAEMNIAANGRFFHVDEANSNGEFTFGDSAFDKLPERHTDSNLDEYRRLLSADGPKYPPRIG